MILKIESPFGKTWTLTQTFINLLKLSTKQERMKKYGNILWMRNMSWTTSTPTQEENSSLLLQTSMIQSVWQFQTLLLKMEQLFATSSTQILIAKQSKEVKLMFLFLMENLRYMFLNQVPKKSLKDLFPLKLMLIFNSIQFFDQIIRIYKNYQLFIIKNWIYIKIVNNIFLSFYYI